MVNSISLIRAVEPESRADAHAILDYWSCGLQFAFWPHSPVFNISSLADCLHTEF